MNSLSLNDPENPKQNIGHVSANGRQVVGPYSIHPDTGTPYLIAEALPLATVTEQQIRGVLAPFFAEKRKEVFTKRFETSGELEFPILSLSIPGLRQNGHDSYTAPHPVHGSSTGTNLHVTPSKNVWHCFRHMVGGGALQLLAVIEGIIPCEGDLSDREDFKKTLAVAWDRGYLKRPGNDLLTEKDKAKIQKDLAKRDYKKSLADKPKEKMTDEQLEENGLSAWKPCGNAEPLDRVDLYNRLLGFFQSWIYCPDPRTYHVFTAWTLHTWQYQKFRSSPPLGLFGPFGSGKTAVIECMEEVAYRGVRAGSMTESVLFRLSAQYGPSFLVDETQLLNNPAYEPIRAAMNERYRPGAKVWRSEPMPDGGFNAVGFPIYGPTLIAGSEEAWEAMIDRAISVIMEKGRPDKRTLTPTFFREGERFRTWLKGFEQSDFKVNMEELDPRLDKPEFDGRMIEKVEPLLACSFTEEAQRAILSIAEDWAKNKQAVEDTGFAAEIFQSYIKAFPEGGKVSIYQVRKLIADARGFVKQTKDGPIIDINAKGMPKTRTVSGQLHTLGFAPCRMSDGSPGVLCNPELEKRLRKRYHLPEQPSEPSEPSESSVRETEGSEGSETSKKRLNAYERLDPSLE